MIRQPQPPSPPVASSAGAAGFGERFAAYFIDGLILGLTIALKIPFALVALILSLIIAATYFTDFWSTSGQKRLGKRALGLKVVSTDGGWLLNPGEAFVRLLGYLVSTIPFGLGFLGLRGTPSARHGTTRWPAPRS